MIMFGQQITKADEMMQKMSIDRLYQMISKPSETLRSNIDRLRIVQTIDLAKYRQLKTTLPYFVCGIFNKGVRRTENFAQISYFVVDFDHVKEKGVDVYDLQKRFAFDDRVCLMFVSPSNDGLKLMFKLQEPLFDTAQFKLFYKTFVAALSKQYQVEQIVDAKTCDVTRACFLSYDENAIFNPEANAIKVAEYVDFQNFEQIRGIQKELFEDKKEEKKQIQEEKKDVSNDILQQIKQTLNPKAAKKEKLVYVPEEINLIMDGLTLALEKSLINIVSIENIQYGKKIKLAAAHIWAELNLFYGKKGFSVVLTTKTGSNQELGELAKMAMEQFLFTYTSTLVSPPILGNLNIENNQQLFN
jgi:hypothetical protein